MSQRYITSRTEPGWVKVLDTERLQPAGPFRGWYYVVGSFVSTREAEHHVRVLNERDAAERRRAS